MSHYHDILPTETLLSHMHDPQWVIVDCRFDLKNPTSGFESYRQGHIPGAVYTNLNDDLASEIIPGKTGRHPLPDVDKLAKRLSQWGIQQDTQVVVYDATDGALAARLWWLLRFLGHPAVALLDGGFPKWQREGHPVKNGVESRAPALFTPSPQWNMLVNVEDVDTLRQDPQYCLIDSRTGERYRGEVESIDAVAGHIPGAVNRFYGNNLLPDGTFLSPEVLRAQFQELFHGKPIQNVVVYCGSGVTACHNLIALERAGLTGARLFPGSWSEWIANAQRPVAKG